MGCCATRDVYANQRDKMQSEDFDRIMREYEQKRVPTATEASESNEESLGQEPDLAHDIERYCKDLLKKAAWTLEHDCDDFQLKSLPDSKFSPDTRIAYMKVRFSSKATIDAVYRALEVPHVRMKWDTGVIEMKETPPIARNTRIVYSAINHAIFGRPKDFVEKKVIKKSHKETKVIFHSSESMSFPVVPGRDRGHTYMLVYCISQKEDSVTLEVVRQTDYKLPWIMNVFGVLGKTYVLAWLTQLKTVVESGAVGT